MSSSLEQQADFFPYLMLTDFLLTSYCVAFTLVSPFVMDWYN